MDTIFKITFFLLLIYFLGNSTAKGIIGSTAQLISSTMASSLNPTTLTSVQAEWMGYSASGRPLPSDLGTTKEAEKPPTHSELVSPTGKILKVKVDILIHNIFHEQSVHQTCLKLVLFGYQSTLAHLTRILQLK